MSSRRMALAGAFVLLTALPAAGASVAIDSDKAEWDVFKFRFLRPDGRILDTGNKGISHTEGQGWGLLFAEYFDDQLTFGEIWDWTARNLHRPADALHSWQYDPGSTTPIADPNNATDGDLFIGMALSRATRRWNDPIHAASATAIGHDVLRLLVRKVGTRTVLLPAASGFESEQDVVLNPSYYVFPALLELATRVRSPVWKQIWRDGLALIRDARFGRWQLPPDWLRVDRASGKLSPSPNWPPRFSYDAIRVPLYLAWSRLEQSTGYQDYIGSNGGRPPAWVDLITDATAPYAAPTGMLAVAMLAAGGATHDLPPDFPAISSAIDYYSAALTLLARIAWRESRV